MLYTSLEPNHSVEIDNEGQYVVWCPFEVLTNGEVVLHDHPVSVTATWGKDSEAEEVECPVCITFNGEARYVGAPDCGDYVEGDHDGTVD